jgi:carbon monoxide dehydrogenase subunit G
MRLEVEQVVEAPREVVWRVLTEWERQPEWMVDAKSVEVLTPRRDGVGTTIRCPTNLLGVTVQDVMRVTAWDPPFRLGVVHLGRVITGEGAFELHATTPGSTRLVWWEEIDPPMGRIGEWGASRLALPVIERIFARSLRRLADLVESARPGPSGASSVTAGPDGSDGSGE